MDFAKGVVPHLEALPKGVNADGISVDPTVLKFSEEISQIAALEELPD